MSSRRTRAAPTPSVPARVGHQAYVPPQQPQYAPTQYGQNPYAQQPQYGQPVPPNYGQNPYSHPAVQYTPANTNPYGQPQQPYGQGQGQGQYGQYGQPQQPYGQGQGQGQGQYGQGQYGQPTRPPGQISPQTGNPQFSLTEVIAIVDQRLVVLEAFMSRFNEMEAQVLPDSINLILRAARELSQGQAEPVALDAQDNQQ